MRSVWRTDSLTTSGAVFLLFIYLGALVLAPAAEQETRASDREPADFLNFIRQQAEKEDASLQFLLGITYYEGRRVPRDYAEAARWYRKAAVQGEAESQFMLGMMYEKGHGVPRDDAEAILWYRKSAEQGNRGAQINLGAKYYQGQGVPRIMPRPPIGTAKPPSRETHKASLSSA